MNTYTVALFLHIVGALGYFATIGVLIVSMRCLRRARTLETIQEWATVSAKTERWIPASAAVLVLAGVYMVIMVMVWRATWVVAALGTLLVLAPIFPLVVGWYLDALRDTAHNAGTGTISSAVTAQLHATAPWITLRVLTATSLGVVFLMTAKPNLAGSLIAIGVALVLGVVAGIPVSRRSNATARERN